MLFFDKDGQPVATSGDTGGIDTTSFGSLVAGNVAATNFMGQLIGEDAFPSVVHEGEQESIFISVLGRNLLVILYDKTSTTSLVKIRAKSGSAEILSILSDAEAECRRQTEAFATGDENISDADIDSLFN